jgi:3-hydroxyacyl-CoA dehydrogenase
MRLVRLERDGSVGVIVIDNPPVNATSVGVRSGLMAAIAAIESDPTLRAAVILGAGRTFVAGADIKEFDLPLADPHMPAVIAAIIGSAKPYVAALHGAALGGGFELALGCDRRIALASTKVGLPETTLGMIPGAGGTQHLPRLVGIVRAIELVCSGRRLETDEALGLGLVDRVVEGDLRTVAVAEAQGLAGKRRLRELPVPLEPEAAIEAAAAAALAAHPGPQTREAIEAVRSAASLPYEAAMARERSVFQRLRESDESRELRRQFFAARAAAKGA